MAKINIRSSSISSMRRGNDYRLLIDGDMLLYRAAWASNSSGRMDDVISSFVYTMYRIIDNLDSDDYTLFLTGRFNYRNNIYPPYKASRVGKTKPGFLSELRTWVINNYNTETVYGYEADDIIADNHDPESTIIVSLDKDFDQLVGFHYKFNKNDLYWVNERQAMLFSAQQLLMGDRIDDIPGLSERMPKRGIGAVRSKRMLEHCQTENDAHTVVYEAYEAKYGIHANYVIMINTYLLTLGSVLAPNIRDMIEALEEELFC